MSVLSTIYAVSGHCLHQTIIGAAGMLRKSEVCHRRCAQLRCATTSAASVHPAQLQTRTQRLPTPRCGQAPESPRLRKSHRPSGPRGRAFRRCTRRTDAAGFDALIGDGPAWTLIEGFLRPDSRGAREMGGGFKGSARKLRSREDGRDPRGAEGGPEERRKGEAALPRVLSDPLSAVLFRIKQASIYTGYGRAASQLGAPVLR